MRTTDAAVAVGLAAAAVGACAAIVSPTSDGRLQQQIDPSRAGSTASESTASGDVVSGLRRCRRCGISKGRECFTTKQWERADPTKRTCKPCCAALDAERIAREQASGLVPSPRAWSGRHNKPSRGKAPRHSFTDKQPIVVAENIDDYRAAISIHVRDTDVVLEIGCHQGSSTVLMDNAGRRAVGVDKGEHVLREGKRLHPQLALHDIDASDIAALTRLNKKEGPFDVIFIDIGGGSLKSVASFWALIETYSKVLRPSPRVFIVKSFKLAELLHRCSVVQCNG
jgi:hypothetical protein